MTVYLYLDDDNVVYSWSSNYEPGTVEASLDPNDSLLEKVGSVRYIDDGLVFDPELERKQQQTTSFNDSQPSMEERLKQLEEVVLQMMML